MNQPELLAALLQPIIELEEQLRAQAELDFAEKDLARMAECDVLSICVPTPLSKTRDPDLSYVASAALAIRAIKECVDRGLETDLSTGLSIEQQQFAAVFATEDSRTGMTSFLENGPGKASFTLSAKGRHSSMNRR